jgi:putative hydrolase of the HAD superfamily
MPFAAVVFDFFGTLTPQTPEYRWREYAALSAAPLDIPSDTWLKALADSYPQRAAGELGDLPATFRELARRCGANPSERQLATACEARRRSQREMARPREDAADTLRAIRDRGLRIGVLTNCTIELVEAWASLPLAEFIDAAIFSCQAGRLKPDAVLYRLIADQLAVPGRQCMYVGDHSSELVGAEQAGMTAVMLRTDETRLEEQLWAGPTIATLHAVPALIGATAG